MSFPLRLLAWLLILGPAFGLRAEIPTLDPYTVVGSRLATSLSSGGGNRLVVSGETIGELNPSGVTDYLRGLPGIHIDHPAGAARSEAVYLQGGEPNFTLVLVDGIRLNDPTDNRGGSGDFSLVDPWFLESLSVLGGSQSSIYGSESLNGVISMSLHPEASDPSVRAMAEWGGRGYEKAGLDWRRPFRNGAWFGGLSYFDEGEPTPGSAFRATRASIGGDWQPAEGWLLQATGLLADSAGARFPDDSGGFRLAEIREREARETRSVGASLRAVRAWADHQVEVRASLYDRDDAIRSPGVAPGPRDPAGIVANDFNNRFRRWQLQAFDRFQVSSTTEAVLGGSWVHESGESASVLYLPGFALPGAFDRTRRTWSGFGELRTAWNRNFSAGLELRWDHIEGAGDEWSPRVTLGWRSNRGDTRLHLAAGRGFKLPSFFALANPVVGNPDLRRETARSLHLVWEQDWGDGPFTSRVTGFAYDYGDLVDFVPGPPPMMMNVDDVGVRGILLEGEWRPGPAWTLATHLSWQDIEVRDSPQTLLNRPDWRGGLRFDWRPNPKAGLHAQVLYVGSRADSSIPTGDLRLPGYWLVGLTGDWQVSDNNRIRLSVDNLLDASYEEKIGFAGLGRRVRLQLSHRF